MFSVSEGITHRISLSGDPNPIIKKKEFINKYFSNQEIWELDFMSFEFMILLYSSIHNKIYDKLSPTDKQILDISLYLSSQNKKSIYDTFLEVIKFDFQEVTRDIVKKFILSTMYGAKSEDEFLSENFSFLSNLFELMSQFVTTKITTIANKTFVINDFGIPIDVTEIIKEKEILQLSRYDRFKILNYFNQSNGAYQIYSITSQLLQEVPEVIPLYNRYDSIIFINKIKNDNDLLKDKNFYYLQNSNFMLNYRLERVENGKNSS